MARIFCVKDQESRLGDGGVAVWRMAHRMAQGDRLHGFGTFQGAVQAAGRTLAGAHEARHCSTAQGSHDVGDESTRVGADALAITGRSAVAGAIDRHVIEALR